MHGAADNVLPINMGRQLRDKWLQTNGCAAKNAPEPSAGQQAHMKTVYECSKAPVTWIANGGGHAPDPSGNNGQKYAPGETWDFFNAAVGGSPGGGGNPNPGTPTTLSTSAAPTPTNPGTACAPRWAQCGGRGWNGATCCQSGSTCQAGNEWYSQCL
jgi:hypothetical protein